MIVRRLEDREYDEPFLILDEERSHHLLAAIRERGRHCTRGGRFLHITGGHDTANAVRLLVELYRSSHADMTTIGLGDGPNDVGFLNVVDFPIEIRSPMIDQVLPKVPRGLATDNPGPKDWNEAILRMLA